MKIMQVITLSTIGGAQRVVANLANEMCSDNEVLVLSGEDGAMWSQLDRRVKRVVLPTLLREVSPLNDLKTIFILRRIYRQFKPDIIHLHSSKAGILGRIAFPKDKIVYTVHGFDSIRVAYRLFLPIEKLMRSRAKAIVGVSHYDSANLRAEGISKNIFTIYNGVSEILRDRSIRLPFANGKRNILVISRTDPPKDFALFVRIAVRLPHYNFIWIGNRLEYSDLPDNVVCMGEVIDASRYYMLGDLSLLISNYEGLPMSIIEALSLGKPVVASNVGGISEIVIDGVTGFTTDNSVEMFVDRISLILGDEELYCAMSQNALRLVGDGLTAGKMAERYLEIYNF